MSCILLPVTGLTHKQAYKDVFVITLTKTAAVSPSIMRRVFNQTRAGDEDRQPRYKC